MKYTAEQVAKITAQYQEGMTAKEIAAALSTEISERTGSLTIVPERSVIAKLSALGIYQRKQYLTKRGEPPTKKEEYIERIAKLLDINVDLLESFEKVTKTALVLLEKKILDLQKKE